MTTPTTITVSGFGDDRVNGVYYPTIDVPDKVWRNKEGSLSYSTDSGILVNFYDTGLPIFLGSWVLGYIDATGIISQDHCGYFYITYTGASDVSEVCINPWQTLNTIYGIGTEPIGTVVCDSSPTTTSTTSSTTTTPTTTTTTTTNPYAPTTTTTTTPIGAVSETTITKPDSLSVVKTSLFRQINGNFKEAFYTDAGDSDQTKNQLFAQCFDFGTLAPGETSETIAIALNVPNCKAIRNIKLALISTGYLAFTTSTFGVTSSVELRSDITPDAYFNGVNIDDTDTNSYNINIPNKDNFHSNYVYLNIKLPISQSLGRGLISLKWFFEYAS